MHRCTQALVQQAREQVCARLKAGLGLSGVTCRGPPDITFINCLCTGPVGFFVPCLYVLQFLQVFWGSKIVNVVLTILSGKELEDPREDE